MYYMMKVVIYMGRPRIDDYRLQAWYRRDVSLQDNHMVYRRDGMLVINPDATILGQRMKVRRFLYLQQFPDADIVGLVVEANCDLMACLLPEHQRVVTYTESSRSRAIVGRNKGPRTHHASYRIGGKWKTLREVVAMIVGIMTYADDLKDPFWIDAKATDLRDVPVELMERAESAYTRLGGNNVDHAWREPLIEELCDGAES